MKRYFNRRTLKILLVLIPILVAIEYCVLRPLSKSIFPMHEKEGYHTLSIIIVLTFDLGVLIYKYIQKVKEVKKLRKEMRDLLELIAEEG